MKTKRKLPKFIDINTFDFTPYGRELTREEAYLVNGGVEIENSIAAQALANPGDTVTDSNGNTSVLTEYDIKWAQEQIGYNEPERNSSRGSEVENASTKEPDNTEDSSSSSVDSIYHNSRGYPCSTEGFKPKPVNNSENNIEQDSSGAADEYTDNNNSSIINAPTELKDVDQKKVARDLGLPENKTCLLTDWIIMYMHDGLTYEKCIKVIKEEIAVGNISTDNSEMLNQLATSKALAKELKGESFDNRFLQYPWPNGKQVLFYSEDDFYNSDYPYAIGQFEGLPSAVDTHKVFYSNNPDLKIDPWPGGVETCPNFTTNKLVVIMPVGWYE